MDACISDYGSACFEASFGVKLLFTLARNNEQSEKDGMEFDFILGVNKS